MVVLRSTMVVLITETVPGMVATMVQVRPTMEVTAALTPPLAITPPPALTRAALQPRQPMALKKWDQRITHTPGLMAPHIKVRTPIRIGEARRHRRTARLSTHNIIRTLMEPSGPRRAQMATSMRQRTATPTRTLGVAGITRVPVLMMRTVGEAAADRSPIVTHRHSVAGAATLATQGVVGGVHGPPARRAGAAVAAAAAGAGDGSVAERN